MSKKLLSILAAVGFMGALSSCSEDKLDIQPGKDGDTVQVTFTISGEDAVASRAGGLVHYPTDGTEWPQISDGSKAKRLIWAVYDKNGDILPEFADYSGNKTELAGPGQIVEEIEQFPHTITLSLVRGMTYSFAFWAQDPECDAFNTTNLRNVQIDYKSAGNNLSNDEFRDAFCKVETFTVSSAPSASRDIILRRPFAQLNLGIPKAEYEALQRSGVRILKSKVYLENVATEFDVVANSTHGELADKRQAVTFDYNYIPAYYNWDVATTGEIPTDEDLQKYRSQYGKTQDLRIDLDKDGKIAAYGETNSEGMDETFNYLLMTYILPADRNDGTSTYSTTLDKVEVTLQPEKEGLEELNFSLENVPVQRNWRTNIFGNIFTSVVTLKIDLDPFYAGEYNYPSWERIYEGVSFEFVSDDVNAQSRAGEAVSGQSCIHISNGAGLVWLSNATNGVWKTKEDFINDNTHNPKGIDMKNDADLMLKAAGLEDWPNNGLFRFEGINIKLDADIDLASYANIFGTDGYFTPIGFGPVEATNQNLKPEIPYPFFSGKFDGQDHTIYNLTTVRPGDNDDRAFGLFGVIGNYAQILNVRLKDIDVLGHLRVGGIAGTAWGSPWNPDTHLRIENCYVDGGSVIAVTNEYHGNDGKNVGGVVGLCYNNSSIQNNFVRNLTLRGYRTIGGVMGQTGGDVPDHMTIGNKVYNCTIIVDWFQYYNNERNSFEIESVFLGESYFKADVLRDNEEADNTIYAFWWQKEGDKKVTTIGKTDLLSNPPLDIFPRMAFYTNVVRFNSSIMGGPSAYKQYTDDTEENHWTGKPDVNSGRVGLWISGIEVDGSNGTTDETLMGLDNYTITASGLTGDNDCVVYVKGKADIKNITFHGAEYPAQAICLAPGSETVTLDGVLAYDAKKVLTDEGTISGATLTVKDSNFRGYVSLGQGYNELSFTNTVFDGSTKRVEETINKLESKSTVTLDGCIFIAPFDIDVPAGSTFNNCKLIVNGNEVPDFEFSTNCSIDSDGNVK